MNELQLVGALFAALLGLAFGSFLNVVLTRLPASESIVNPGSHCRNCTLTLTWWENLPVLSWLILRGRCRQCQTRISLRYPLVELFIGTLWTLCWMRYGGPILNGSSNSHLLDFWGQELPLQNGLVYRLAGLIGYAILCWLLVALAALDTEHFWLPDRLTLPGIGVGFTFTLLRAWTGNDNFLLTLPSIARQCLFAILVAAGLVLFIRFAYWLVRRKEGMGLGDAKLMAMLGAWFGLTGSLESFVLAVAGATVAALVWLLVVTIRKESKEWAKMPLPLGTFLCLAALSEIFYPDWLLNWYTGGLLH